MSIRKFPITRGFHRAEFYNTNSQSGEFKVLYVHKVDRLARRLEWSLEIVHELQALDINFKAVQQPFDLGTPEGKLMFHLISSLGEFYCDNVSKEANKGKLERSLQGYHNGAVPWGYTSQLVGIRKVGVPDPEKVPVVVEMFERYATGAFSDQQIAEWLNAQGFHTNKGHPFSKDSVRDMLSNSYYMGQIRYRGMTVRPKGVSYRSTPPQVSEGQHEPIISEGLWQRARAMRASRRRIVKTIKRTVRLNLLQGLAVCANCGRRLRVQTPKSCQPYYREESHLRGFQDCPSVKKSVRAELIDDQIAELIQSIRLPENWEPVVRQMLDKHREWADPEVERKEIRGMIRLMRENFERGLYEGEEYQYWQKVSSLKEKLGLLERVPEPALNRAARTLLDLRETWDNSTKEEQKQLVNIMIQEVGVDVPAKRALWVKPRPDYDPLFSIMAEMCQDADRRFWINCMEPQEDNCDTEADTGLMRTSVEIVLQMSHNVLTGTQEHVK